MGRKLKVETSSDVPRKFSANFVNLQNCPYGLRTTLGQSLEIFGLEIAQNATSSSKGSCFKGAMSRYIKYFSDSSKVEGNFKIIVV
jgi:hypothetical protein